MQYIKKSAKIDGNYRYSLTRIWDAFRPIVLWIMLNPSTADADRDDATIRKIVKISDNNGFGGLYVGNVYAYRTKNPGELFKDANIDYAGKYIYLFIQDMLCHSEKVVFACGRLVKKKELINLYKMVKVYHDQIYCLGYNKDGTPVHPLYQRDDSKFQVYDIKKLEVG